MLGPLAEIHDACTITGQAALFGFVGISSIARQALGSRLQSECIAQLVRLFGAEAGDPAATLFKDWATEPLTAVPSDLVPSYGHANSTDLNASTEGWAHRMILAGSEVAVEHCGYLEGALEAAEAAVAAYLNGPYRKACLTSQYP